MSLLAHAGSGMVNTWGFAYVGGVVGLISSALYYVHRSVLLRSGAGPATRFSMRWIVPIGFVAGISIGLGTGRLLASALDAPPTADELVTDVCRAMSQGDPAAFADVHDDLEHFTADTDAPLVAAAHDALDRAIVVSPDRIGAEAHRLVAALAPSVDGSGSPCSATEPVLVD